MLLDEDKVGTSNVKVVICSPQAFNLCGRGMGSDSRQKEYVAGYGKSQRLVTPMIGLARS